MVTVDGTLSTGDPLTTITSADRITLTVDGGRPLSAEAIAAVDRACDQAEDLAEPGAVLVRISGAPGPTWSEGLTVARVSKWERALRRLERLPTVTIAVAEGDCGGPALDALLATDYRVAAGSLRLLSTVAEGVPWPGMALYRLGRQGAYTAAIRRMVLFGVPLEAADALALHLVDEVTDDVVAAVARVGAGTAGFSGPELAIRRQLLLDAATIGFDEALGGHLAACDRILRRRSGPAA
jgi:isomerase DpgB